MLGVIDVVIMLVPFLSSRIESSPMSDRPSDLPGHHVIAKGPGSTEGLVKGASRAQRGRSHAKHAKTLDEPEASRTIGRVMA
jgi:hypothetical protein